MAGIGTTEKALQNAAKFAPLMGKAFIQVFIAFRLMLAWKLHKVFKDSEKHLECDVETIGCSRMCHNWFYPIALERYWQFQVFCVALPSIIFIAYKSKVDIHIKQALKIKKKVDAELEKLKKEKCEEEGIEYKAKEESKIQSMSREWSEQNTKFNKLQSHVPPKLFLAYWFHVVFRLIIDVLFTVYQFRIFIYKFVMPEVFQCSQFPCKGGMESEDNTVTCYIAAPIQRTVFINLHFGATVCTMFLAMLDIYSIGFKPVAKAWYRRGEDWTKAYLDHEKPMFFQTADYSDGFIDTRGVASAEMRAYARQQSSGGFIMSSGVNYKRSQSVRRQKSVLYRSASIQH